VASDGTIYWPTFSGGLVKSTDKGLTFSQVADNTKAGTWTPAELPDGRIASATSSAIMVSADKGATWTQAGKNFPSGYNPNSFTYSPFRNAFYIARFSCTFTNDAVQADAIMRMGYAWQ
jgi:hypothetical protein